jgi:putative flippase GtrA
MSEHHPISRFVKSTLAGGVATLSDLGVLGLLGALGVPVRVASIPALLVGGAFNFVGNRSFAFQAKGSLGRHLSLFMLVEGGTLLLNALIFDVVVRALPLAQSHYLLTRLVVSNLVFIAFSYPLWQRVFAQPQTLPRHSQQRTR